MQDARCRMQSAAREAFRLLYCFTTKENSHLFRYLKKRKPGTVADGDGIARKPAQSYDSSIAMSWRQVRRNPLA